MKSLAAIVPVIAYAVMAIGVRARLGDWRTALLVAAVLWGLAVVGITEMLSPWRLLHRPGLLTAWLVLGVAVAVAALRPRLRAHAWPRRRLDLGSWTLVAGAGALALAVGVTALVAPPNTFDAMTYHMPRVAHWTQNASVAPYPTGTARELYQSPGAEFVILHFQVLAGDDRLANLPQWIAMIGSALAASLIARYLGGGAAVQAFAAVIVATLPMGLLQASGTKNDYVVAFWLMTMLALALAPRRGLTAGWPWSMAVIGGAFGLAVLTKPTAYLFGVPFLGLAVARWWQAWGLRRAGVSIAVIGLVAGAVNAGHYARNTAVYGSPFGPPADHGYAYGAETLAPASIASTLVRNIALHVATPSEHLNVYLQRALERGHRVLGLDLDDPRVTWRGEHFIVHRWLPDEDRAGNPLHLLLIAAAVVVAAVQARRRPILLAYAGALVVGWVLFSAVLKWQPWHSRLQLAFFAMGAPLAAVAVGERPRLRAGLGVLLVIAALPAVLWNTSRPLVGADSVLRRDRLDLYFRGDRQAMTTYLSAAQAFQRLDCDLLGIDTQAGEVLEYPFWLLTEDVRHGRTRIEHVGGAQLPTPSGPRFAPCAIVAWNHPIENYAYEGRLYPRVWASPMMTIYAACGPPPLATCPGPPAWPLLTRLTRIADDGRRLDAGRQPIVRIESDADAIRVGQQLSLRVDVRLPEGSPPLSLYAGALLPDGAQAVVIAPGPPPQPVAISQLAGLRPAKTPLVAGSREQIVLYAGRIPAWFPTGEYQIFAALAPSDLKGSPDPEDFVAADVRRLYFLR